MPEFTVDPNGRPMQGPTAAKPTNPFNGEVYFDTEVGISLVWNGSVWCSGIFLGREDVDLPVLSLTPPGLTVYDITNDRLLVSDGAAWLETFTEDHEESSSTSSSSST